MKVKTSAKLGLIIIGLALLLTLIYSLLTIVFGWPFKLVAVFLLVSGLSFNAPFQLSKYPTHKGLRLGLCIITTGFLIVPGYGTVKPVFNEYSTWFAGTVGLGLLVIAYFIKMRLNNK